MIPSTSLGQDELRAKSQQGLQAMKSGVESLRTVLANHPIEPRQGDHSQDSSSSTSTSRPGSHSSSQLSHPPLARSSIDAEALNQTAATTTTTTSTTTTTRARSGSWSFLPPSLSGKPSQGPTTQSTTPSSSSTSTSTLAAAQHQHRPTGLTRTGSIADSVTESIKSLGTGLKLGQLAGGLGLTGGSGSTKVHSRRGTTDSLDHQQQHSSSSSLSLQDPQQRGPYLNGAGGGSASRSRVWGWTGPETNNNEEPSDRGTMTTMASSSSSSTDPSDTVLGKKTRPTETILRTGTKTRQAAHETETLLAKLRDQQDVAMERMRRMPQVEKMTQRYQDSWRDIHDHTTRNSEKADDAEEILEKVLEICTRHINASVQLAEEAKDLKDLDKSMDEMVSMSENIRRKLIGLESKIQTLEENAEVMSLADWKKSQTLELDKYMEAKKNELWDKAEMLSTRSEQFQKEEAARKLHQYQNQFQTDMERFRRTQEERQQEWLSRHHALETPETTTTTTTTTSVDPMAGAHGSPSSGSAPRNGSKKRILRVPHEKFPVALLSSEVVHEEEQRRDKEDLDQFLGPATESDSKDDDDDDEDEDEDAEDGTEDETELSEDGTEEEDDDDEEEEDASDEDLDPIAKARKARAMAAAAAQEGGGASKVPGSGSTISAFSALGRHASPSTLSLSKS
ncbi:hypothetical protein KVV02_006202 [Mortierella alpina]|uniref:Uncharacterized protein n=1 Tax=Mortierella alpina TaxID=64518 RepID=A0A9P8A860_MORAP|nr:hypothetical protein KVV02_006202 [Mortierella alpina]